ncbi:MAG TPA: aspartyl-tRNA amidotransferase [Anaerolineae bacterium]|nr:aspartyl-tRNA amidotransferase [Anaerolineae bacterium]HCM96959.1 aspartyl-tRNA amidotransferase [Anaerolineae bacterium]
MRAGDDITKRTIRMVLAAIKQTEIDRQVTLDEAAILGIIQKEIKTRRESLEEAHQASRPDLVAAADSEINVLKGFLPEELSDNDLMALAKEAVSECGAVSPADMGKVMKILLPRVQGRAPGDRISQAVRHLLQK